MIISKKLFVICFLPLLLFLYCSGCSFLILKERLAMSNNPKWEYKNSSPKTQLKTKFQYHFEDISIFIDPELTYRSCPISTGPLLLPNIPLFNYCSQKKENLWLNFVVETNDKKVIIEAPGIKMIDLEGNEIKYSKAESCNPPSDYSIFRCRFYPNENNQSILDSSIIANKGKTLFKFYYPNIGKSNELKIQFGKMYSNKKQIILPPINLKFYKDRIIYIPIMYTGHDPEFTIYRYNESAEEEK